MNLIFRLLWVLLKPVSKTKNITDSTFYDFRVWPFDCDLNLHLTNSRYLALMDLGRIDFMRKNKVLKKALKSKLQAVVESQEITYLRGAAPFSQIKLETSLQGWDNKYYYFCHHFWQQDKVIAKALMRGVFLKSGKVIDDGSWVTLLSTQNPVQMDEQLVHWANQLLEQRQKAKEYNNKEL